jgi:LmbE family N-acetylglucosaminyl deacetylase
VIVQRLVVSSVAACYSLPVQVGYVIFTNGDKGCSNAICQNSTREQIASIRYQEALNAAQSLGVKAQDVFLLDYEDSMLPS